MSPRALPPEACTVFIDPDDIVEVVDEGAPEQRMTAQSRAISALRHGLAISSGGFHIAVVGSRGTGRTFTALAMAGLEAARRPAPRDLVLLPNPHRPLEPTPAFLPPGSAPRLIRAMQDLHGHLEGAVHDILEGAARSRLTVEVERERSAAERKIQTRLSDTAERYGLCLTVSDAGYELTPVGEGGFSDDEAQLDQLWLPSVEEEERQQELEATGSHAVALTKLGPEIEEARRELGLLEAHSASDLARRQRGALRRQIEASFASVPEEALPTPEVRAHVQALHAYLIECYRLEQDGDALPLPTTAVEAGLVVPTLLTSADERDAAPIVHAQSPTVAGMFGRVVMGPEETHYPDPGTILPGDLHRANGGFLVVDAEALVTRAPVYEHLRSCLLANAILPLEEGEGQILRPHPIELDVKLILIADPDLIQQLQEMDAEFTRLFKIRADFTEDMERHHALTAYPRLFAWLAKHRGLPMCDRSAIARLITHGSRLAEDQGRATAELGQLADLVTEAAWLAGRPPSLTASHIIAALAAIRERDGQLRERLLELHEHGTVRVRVEGRHVGQLNGLAVVSDGFVSVGRPLRVTAVTYAGTAGPLNVEREVELSGPLHSKGVLILTGYLADRFARLDPPSFGASLVFEQNYSPVDGDSASMVELLAILSSLSRVPARQDIAVTGGVDQQGKALPVGGVNEKIEGFFDLCRHLRLTGDQGVVIPQQNVRNLILREDVVEAIANGQFHIWSVDCVEEAVELVMGMEAGTPIETKTGVEYVAGSLYARIEERLDTLRRRRPMIVLPAPTD